MAKTIINNRVYTTNGIKRTFRGTPVITKGGVSYAGVKVINVSTQHKDGSPMLYKKGTGKDQTNFLDEEGKVVRKALVNLRVQTPYHEQMFKQALADDNLDLALKQTITADVPFDIGLKASSAGSGTLRMRTMPNKDGIAILVVDKFTPDMVADINTLRTSDVDGTPETIDVVDGKGKKEVPAE